MNQRQLVPYLIRVFAKCFELNVYFYFFPFCRCHFQRENNRLRIHFHMWFIILNQILVSFGSIFLCGWQIFWLFWRNYRFNKCLLFAGPAHFNILTPIWNIADSEILPHSHLFAKMLLLFIIIFFAKVSQRKHGKWSQAV